MKATWEQLVIILWSWFFMSAGVFYKARHIIHHMLINSIHHSYSYDAPQVIERKPARNFTTSKCTFILASRVH